MNLLFRERTRLLSADMDYAYRDSFPNQRHAQRGTYAVLAGKGTSQRVLLGFRCKVERVDRSSFNGGASGQCVAYERKRLVWNRNRAVVTGDDKMLAFHPEDNRIVGIAQPCGTHTYGVKNRLRVRRRPHDDPKNVCARCLLRQCLLRLVEETNVFNRYDGLVSKSGQQILVLLCNRPGLRPGHHDGSN